LQKPFPPIGGRVFCLLFFYFKKSPPNFGGDLRYEKDQNPAFRHRRNKIISPTATGIASHSNTGKKYERTMKLIADAKKSKEENIHFVFVGRKTEKKLLIIPAKRKPKQSKLKMLTNVAAVKPKNIHPP
jgi:hypothetical protein